MIVPFLTPFKDQVSTYAYKKNVFTKEECKLIIKTGESYSPKESLVGVKKKSTKDTSLRSSRTAWIPFNADHQWIYSRIAEKVLELNEEFFNFDIRGFNETLQFTHYHHKKKGQFKSHVDSVSGIEARKLSVSVQLSSETYKGGDLEIITGSHPKDRFKMIKDEGAIIVFPSYTLHKVTPVTKGERYSLVSWLTGPSFK
tara:strand:+ start:66 stop:662 length:597 start_codon:yes stop_codon:yes gene_type:complete